MKLNLTRKDKEALKQLVTEITEFAEQEPSVKDLSSEQLALAAFRMGVVHLLDYNHDIIWALAEHHD